MQSSPAPFHLEEFASGRYDVLAENGRRAGSIIGGNARYAAEIGSRTLGWYSSKKQAATVVLEHAGITGLFQQMHAILARTAGADATHHAHLLDFDRLSMHDWQCATDSLWAIHRSGTSLIHLDLPLSNRQTTSVLDAFTSRSANQVWQLYHIDVNALLVKPLTEAAARMRISQPALYQLAGNCVCHAAQEIAEINVIPRANGACAIRLSCNNEPSSKRMVILKEIARQYWHLHLAQQYQRLELVTVSHADHDCRTWRFFAKPQ